MSLPDGRYRLTVAGDPRYLRGRLEADADVAADVDAAVDAAVGARELTRLFAFDMCSAADVPPGVTGGAPFAYEWVDGDNVSHTETVATAPGDCVGPTP
eukprot:6676288-Pyramimonas_sp.AAC.1